MFCSDATKLHGIIARNICRTYRHDLHPHYESLSDHFTRASLGNQESPALDHKVSSFRESALEFTLKAADQALRYGKYAPALYYMERAYKLSRFPDEFQVCSDVLEIAADEIETADEGLTSAMLETFQSLRKRVAERSSSLSTAGSMSSGLDDELSFSFSRGGVSYREESRGMLATSFSAGEERPSLQWAPSFTAQKQAEKRDSSVDYARVAQGTDKPTPDRGCRCCTVS